MNEMTATEMSSLHGGFDPATTTVVIAIGVWIMASWPEVKKGFTDGLVDGLNAIE